MIAVPDTSVLILLVKAGRLELLERLLDETHLASAVYREATAGDPSRMDASVIRASVDSVRFKVNTPDPKRVAKLEAKFTVLGDGEREAIALCLERPDRQLLMDDRLGRHAARLEGLRPVGTLGVLGRALTKGHLTRHDLDDSLRRLIEAGLWIAPDVLETFRQRFPPAPQEP